MYSKAFSGVKYNPKISVAYSTKYVFLLYQSMNCLQLCYMCLLVLEHQLKQWLPSWTCQFHGGGQGKERKTSNVIAYKRSAGYWLTVTLCKSHWPKKVTWSHLTWNRQEYVYNFMYFSLCFSHYITFKNVFFIYGFCFVIGRLIYYLSIVTL